MEWIEIKYACMIGNLVRNYKRISSNLWQFSCPLCGDSSKKKNKARGYIYNKKNQLRYHCHNCSVDVQFKYFLKSIDEGLYMEMRKETFSDNNNDKSSIEDFKKIAQPKFDSNLKSLKRISQLPSSHFCKKYIESRKIPTWYHNELYFTAEFKAWTNTMIPEKFNIKYDESRLVIPFLDKNKKAFGYQGRSFKDDGSIKYLTIMLDSNRARLYGLDRLNINKRFYALEGPIDSMFVKNSIASAGSDITSEIEKASLNKTNAVIIYDNEPRNIDTIKKINKAIKKGYSVVIWPDSNNDKDINKMFLSRVPIMEMINGNIYRGLEAELRLSQWKKI